MTPSEKTILVLHGITMSGPSMLRTLGPLRARLEALGFELVAPTAPHRMSAREIAELEAWMRGLYVKAAEDPSDTFRVGRFWDEGEHHDWFQANTDKATGEKTYHAVERSLDTIAAALQGKHAVGVLGFSQGAAMAILVAGLALKGDPRFAGIRFGIFVSGFKPVFDHPKLVTYPLRGPFSGLFAIGERDTIFPGTETHLRGISSAFADATHDHFVVEGLGHDIPSSPEAVERLARFAAAH